MKKPVYPTSLVSFLTPLLTLITCTYSWTCFLLSHHVQCSYAIMPTETRPQKINKTDQSIPQLTTCSYIVYLPLKRADKSPDEEKGEVHGELDGHQNQEIPHLEWLLFFFWQHEGGKRNRQ